MVLRRLIWISCLVWRLSFGCCCPVSHYFLVVQPLVCLDFCVLLTWRIFCCFLVWPHFHLEICIYVWPICLTYLSLYKSFVGFVVLGCSVEFTWSLLLPEQLRFCFLYCFFSLFLTHGILYFVLIAIFLGTNMFRALSSSLIRSFNLLSIGVSTECKAMNESLIVDILSLRCSQSVLL